MLQGRRGLITLSGKPWRATAKKETEVKSAAREAEKKAFPEGSYSGSFCFKAAGLDNDEREAVAKLSRRRQCTPRWKPRRRLQQKPNEAAAAVKAAEFEKIEAAALEAAAQETAAKAAAKKEVEVKAAVL